MSIFFYKENRRRAPAERFNSERAAPGEKIENARADDCIAQTGKDRSFDPIHRRSNTVLGNCQADAAGAAGDYSHGDERGVAAGCCGASSEAAEGEGMGVSDSLKILPNGLEKLAANSFVDRELRVEFQLAAKCDRTRCR